MTARTGITFLYGDEHVSIECIDPNTTVLSWLRTHRLAAGTKEGCATGDCGACTVAVAERSADGELHYSSINSCITPVSALDRKQLISVEKLGNQNNLHPVQAAMVESHASQCGFCTPGFVMSMFCMLHSDATANRESIVEGLSGNLCRCTGYRPIIEAATRVLQSRPVDAFSQNETLTLAALAALPDSDTSLGATTDANDSPHAFVPHTLEAATAWLARHPDTRMVAGATDLGLELTQQLAQIPKLIDISHVDALKEINTTPTHLVIGAGASLQAATAAITPHYPSFGKLMQRYGSPAIRARGTIGGNLGTASPIGDTGPVLLALDATINIASVSGIRQVQMNDFFVDYRRNACAPGEIIHSIEIPVPAPNEQFRVYKISKRLDDDISAVCAAYRITLRDGVAHDVRVAFGGMAATAKRATACEQALEGQPWNESAIANAVLALNESFTPMSDARASDRYRLRVAGNLFIRLLLDTRSGSDSPALSVQS